MELTNAEIIEHYDLKPEQIIHRDDDALVLIVRTCELEGVLFNTPLAVYKIFMPRGEHEILTRRDPDASKELVLDVLYTTARHCQNVACNSMQDLIDYRAKLPTPTTEAAHE